MKNSSYKNYFCGVIFKNGNFRSRFDAFISLRSLNAFTLSSGPGGRMNFFPEAAISGDFQLFLLWIVKQLDLFYEGNKNSWDYEIYFLRIFERWICSFRVDIFNLILHCCFIIICEIISHLKRKNLMYLLK